MICKMSSATAFVLAAHALLAQPVTFNKHIAPILFKNCAPCHRPGESGPFSLLTYDDAKKHARQIVAVTKNRYMPPWLPEAGVGKFADERRLSENQIHLIERWVEQGEAQGQASDLPPLPKFAEGWQLGEPDLVLRLPKPYTLAAGSSDVYRNFIYSFPLEAARYVRALEIRPGNKRVVHHANLLIDRNRSSRWKDGRDGQPGFAGMDLKIEANVQDPESHLLFWKPGSVLSEEPDGMAWIIERGTDLILNMHLQPSGKPEIVEPSLGLYFTKGAPRLRPLLVQLENDRALDIPPGATNFSVADDFTLPVDADLLAVYPHAHFLGTHVEAVATLPDGTKTPLIRIPRWDLNWQAVYRYEKPVFLPKGTTIAMRWTYDNSSGNPRNPSRPPQRVVAGDRSTDEMGHVWLQLLPRGLGDQRMTIQEALMRKRVQRDPNDFTAHFNLGGVLQAKGDPEAAIRELREAVRIRPRDEIALNTLGAYLQLRQQAGEAEASYRRALEVRPDYPDAHYNLADLLLSADRVPEAIVHLREVLRLQPDDAKARATLAEALDTRAHELARSGDLKEAAAAFRELVALKPEDADAQTNLGVALARQGQLTEAKLLFERALLLDPQNTAARQNLERVEALLAKRP
jgi:Flp pilus assembly protein TadD